MSIPPLALSMGEPTGIGPEITLKAWAAREPSAIYPFVYLGDPDLIEDRAQQIGLPVKIAIIDEAGQAVEKFANSLPIFPVTLATPSSPGQLDKSNVPAVLKSIKLGVELLQKKQTSALVTNPIQKKILNQAGFAHPGHTEYLADLCDAEPKAKPVMMLVAPELKVVPVTIHLELKNVAEALSIEHIVTTGQITAKALMDYFATPAPRLAIAGLNPHAGEGGLFGTQEKDIIAPAIAKLKMLGIDAFGPASADSLFHEKARQSYDAALCMYHDQALIPIKTLSFDDAVNITLGLPFIRTSPDHGTALDIAGKGQANPNSLIAALKLAQNMAENDADLGAL